MERNETGTLGAGSGADANNGSYSDIQYSSERQSNGRTTGVDSERETSDWEQDNISVTSSMWGHRHRPQARASSVRDPATSILPPPPVARHDNYSSGMSNAGNNNSNLNIQSSTDGSIVASSDYDTATRRYTEITSPYPYASPPATPAPSYSPPYSQYNSYPISPVPHRQTPPISFPIPSEGTMHTVTLPPSASYGGASVPTTVLTPTPQGPVPGWTLLPTNGPFRVPPYKPASDGALCCYFICGLFLGALCNIIACVAIFAVAYFMRDERAKKALISGTIVGIIVGVLIFVAYIVLMVTQANSTP